MRQPAQALGRVGVELARDPHVVGRVAHRLRADVEVELLVDGVVGRDQALEDRDAAAIAVVVGVDVDRHAGLLVGELQRLRVVGRLADVDVLAQRAHQHHDLEDRTGLALALGGEVELRGRVLARGGHRLDVAGLGVHRDQRRRRVAGVRQAACDRRARLALELEVDGRVDLQPAPAQRAPRRTRRSAAAGRSRRSSSRAAWRSTRPCLTPSGASCARAAVESAM